MPRNNYGALARLLHRVALGSDAVADLSFDLENALHPVRGDEEGAQQRPVFVTGLARAGTTLLMRLLYGTGEFCSLTYRDMPFLLAPNLWHRLSGKSSRAGQSAERAHGDGLLVDFDSPEALEEVFWRVHSGERYIMPDRLRPMERDAELEAKFRRYVAQVRRRYGGRRYLSKNNNNILRLSTLRGAFPQATILVPFRHPLDQAASLLRQHQRFTAMQRDDKFVRSYMTWLVHHEFGSDHRPFDWGHAAQPAGAHDELDYWLAQWTHAYSALLDRARDPTLGLVLADYDKLVAAPQPFWQALCEKAGLPTGLAPGETVRPPPPADRTHDSPALRDAEEVHRALKALAF